jgi:hypothetical protein
MMKNLIKTTRILYHLTDGKGEPSCSFKPTLDGPVNFQLKRECFEECISWNEICPECRGIYKKQEMDNWQMMKDSSMQKQIAFIP